MITNPAPLLDRDAELKALDEVLERAVAGEGAAALVEGLAGIGKTMLLAAVGTAAAARGMRVLRARGAPLERALAFGVAGQLLDRAIAGLDDGRGAPPEASRDELGTCHGLYWRCAGLAGDGPVCLLIDDAQWADGPSLRFVEFLVRRIEGLPVAVVIAARDGAGVPLEAAYQALRVLRPAPLGEAAVARMAQAALGACDATFCRACREATGGNPFLLAELLREAAVRGLAPDATGAASVGRIDVPRVSAAIQARLATQLPAARALAQAAAVLGDGSELRLAAAVAGVAPVRAGEAADALVEVAILAAERPLRFLHPIVGGAVMATIALGGRARLHQRAARLLAAESADPQRVAAHVMAAEPGAVDGAAELLVAAARAARRRGATAQAIAYLGRALREPVDGGARAALLATLGSAELALGRAEAHQHLREAHGRLGDPILRARMTPELVRAMLPGDAAAEVLTLIDETADAVRPHDAALSAGLFAIAATITETRPELTDHVEDRLERITAGPVRTSEERVALGHLARRRMERGASAGEAVRIARRALEDEADVALRPLDYLPAILVLIQADELAPAARLLDGQRRAAAARGAASDFAVASAIRAVIELKTGALGEAEGAVREAIDAAEFAGWQNGAMVSALMLSLLAQGDVDGAAAALERTGLTGPLPNYRPFTPLLEARGRLRIAMGSLQDGLDDLLEALIRTDAGRASNPVGLDVRVLVIRTRLALGQGEHAEAVVCDLELRARAWGTPRALGLAAFAAGLPARSTRRVEHFREAAELMDRSPGRLDTAEALLGLGGALRRTNQRAQARPPLRAALEMARACGAGPVAREIEEELKATGARPRKVLRAGLDELTPSERRIARSAAAGASNAEIAGALFLSVKTVEMHLSSAYRKLDICSRVKLGEVMADAGSAPGDP